jgi:hypothetical protein
MTIPWKTLKKRAFEAIDTLRDSMIELSERIGDNPEVAFQEHNAAQWISDVFKRMGFRVEKLDPIWVSLWSMMHCPDWDMPVDIIRKGLLRGEQLQGF